MKTRSARGPSTDRSHEQEEEGEVEVEEGEHKEERKEQEMQIDQDPPRHDHLASASATINNRPTGETYPDIESNYQHLSAWNHPSDVHGWDEYYRHFFTGPNNDNAWVGNAGYDPPGTHGPDPSFDTAQEPMAFHRNYSYGEMPYHPDFESPLLPPPGHQDHQESRSGEGVVSNPHYSHYGRNCLHALQANNGFCFSQSHVESFDRKMPARDRRDESQPMDRRVPGIDTSHYFQYPEQAPSGHSYYPMQDHQGIHQALLSPHASLPNRALDQNNGSSESPDPSPTRSYSQVASNTSANTKLKDPPVASLPKTESNPSSVADKKKTKKMPKRGKTPPKKGPSTRTKTPRRVNRNRTTYQMGWRPSPTDKEIEKARTPRKQNALRTWYQRLRELIEFREQNGHSKYPLNLFLVD
jgi:hypothetical protein